MNNKISKCCNIPQQIRLYKENLANKKKEAKEIYKLERLKKISLNKIEGFDMQNKTILEKISNLNEYYNKI